MHLQTIERKKLFHSRIYIDMDNKNTMIVVAVRSRFSLVAFLSEYKLRKKFQQEIEGMIKQCAVCV